MGDSLSHFDDLLRRSIRLTTNLDKHFFRIVMHLKYKDRAQDALHAQIKNSFPGLIFAQSNVTIIIIIFIIIIRLHELSFVLRRSRR